MKDLIIFNVGSNRYALNIDNVQRIIQANTLTDIPNSNKCIDGMMSYEHSVIKVLNFRKLIGLSAHEEDAREPDEYSQKFIIFDKDGICFAIKVDSIEDIAHIEEDSIMDGDNETENNQFLELDGVLDLDGVLINVIKTLNSTKLRKYIMAITYEGNVSTFESVIYEDEVVAFREYLQEKAGEEVHLNFINCEDIHLAIIQLIMAYKKNYECTYEFGNNVKLYQRVLEGFDTSENHCN